MPDSGVSPELALVDQTLREELVRALPPIELDRPTRVIPSTSVALLVDPGSGVEGSDTHLLVAALAYTIRTIAEFAVIASIAVATVTIVVLVLAAAGRI